MRRWTRHVVPQVLLPRFALALLVAGCSDSGTLPSSQLPGSAPASVTECTANPAQVRTLLAAASTQPGNTGPIQWDAIVAQVAAQDIATAQDGVLRLIDAILVHNRQGSLQISETQVTSLINQMTCYVGLGSSVSSSSNSWVVHVSDPTTALITSDTTSGIRFPSDAVIKNTLVTATPIAANSITTLLDNYAVVYEFKLTPAQTLTTGTKALIGMCPDPASLNRLPAGEIDALLDRLVLGHQKSPGQFEVLAREPLPPEMQLRCPTTPPANTSLGQRLLNTLSTLLLPARANAANRRRFNGGVGGSTSEFSPFGTVDPELFSSGGVGGSTSEFVRTGGAALLEPGTVDGTAGTIRTGANLPAVTITTRLGTPIPHVIVTWQFGPSTNHTPGGDASLCGSTPETNSLGTAAVTCLNFGNTTQYRTAYSKLTEIFELPDQLSGKDAQGNPVVSISPPAQSWLIVTHGPSSLVVTEPPAGRTVAGGNPFSADSMISTRVEIRSDLGDIVTAATNTIVLTLNKNTFGGGATSMVANAVGGVANFLAKVPTAATGYNFQAAPTVGDMGSAAGNFFDVVAGATSKITVVGSSNYGTVSPSANPVFPPPSVVVTDSNNNPKAGVTVYWSPSGGNGAQVNGSASQTSAATAANGTSSVTWLLGGGGNQLRASLQSGAGGAQVFFNGTLTTPSPNDPCEPGAVKDSFGNCFFVTPSTGPGTTFLRMIDNILGLPDVPKCTPPLNPMLRPQGTGC